MSLQDFTIYDPQNHTRASKRPYIGPLSLYVDAHRSEPIMDFFHPQRGVIITNQPSVYLGFMRDAYETITRGEPKHSELINADRKYREAFTIFGALYHALRCCAVDEGAIQTVFNFDSDTVAWIFDVLDELYGEEKAYAKFHAPLPSCYAIGW